MPASLTSSSTGDADLDAVLSGMPSAAAPAQPYKPTGDPDLDAVLAGTSKAPAAPVSSPRPARVRGADVIGGDLTRRMANREEDRPITAEQFKRGLVGVGETTLHELSKAGVGLLTTPASMGDPNPANTEYIRNKYTYEPRTEEGKLGSAAVDWTLGIPKRVGGKVTEATGVPELGGATEFLLGNLPLIRGANAAPAISAARAADSISAGSLYRGPMSAVEPPPSLTQIPRAPILDVSPALRTPFHSEERWFDRVQQPENIAPLHAEVSGPLRAAPFEPENPPPHQFSGEGDIPVAEAGSRLTPEAEASNAEVLRNIGLPEIRRSAVEGNAAEAANDFGMTRYRKSEHGQLMADQFALERQALEKKSDELIDKTGGTAGLDQESRYNRGQAIMRPFEDLQSWFKQKTDDLYAKARAKLGDTQVQTPTFSSIAMRDSEFANTEELALRGALRARMQEYGMMDADGKPMPTTAAQAEQLRQYLNEKWSPQNAGVVRKLKDALDDDVTQSAGQDVFAEARAMRAQRGRTLDDPKGISKLLDSDGINRRVDYENVPRDVTSMGADQYGHVVDILDRLPPELSASGEAARAELKAQFLNRMKQVGAQNTAVGSSWRAPQVTAFLKQNNRNMARTFTPEELNDIDTVNKAGQILRTDRSYEGAHAQAYNTEALSNATRGVASLVGGAARLKGGPIVGRLAGAAVEAGGEAAAEGLSRRASRRLFESRMLDENK